MISISLVKKIDSDVAKGVNTLLAELSSRAQKISRPHLIRVTDPKRGALFLMRDGKKIVGMGMIIWIYIPLEFYARIEDVVITSSYRGKGLGKMLMERLIAYASKKNAHHIDITSRPSREGADTFYLKFGFQKRETNVYRLPCKKI